jgi:hypothetical protein
MLDVVEVIDLRWFVVLFFSCPLLILVFRMLPSREQNESSLVSLLIIGVGIVRDVSFTAGFLYREKTNFL